MNLPNTVRFLSEKNVLSLLTPADAIAAVEDTFLHIGLGDVTLGDIALLHVDAARRNNFHSMPAVLHHKGVGGVKWIPTYSNPLPGYPFSHGNLVILSDAATGWPLAVVGASNITTMRTAGGHGVVQAKYLCKKNPKVLSVFGCGAQAKAGIRGFLTQFPTLQTIRLFSRSRQPMERLQQELNGQVDVVLCDAPSAALEGSELVLMASGARQPLVTAEDLRPGMTIVGMEGFRDLDPRITKAADKWYLGHRKADSRILESPVLNPNKQLDAADIYADLTEVLTGKIAGRESDEEIIVSTHMGLGAHDVSCAELIYRRAVERGVGQTLLLD